MKNFLKYFVLTLLFFLTSVSFSYAYISYAYTTRSVYFSHPTQFDGYWNASKIAVLKGTSGTLDAVFHQGLPQVAYRGYIYFQGSWKTASVTLMAPGSVVLSVSNVTFPVTANDRLAAYIEPTNGGESYYGTSEALVYEKESIQTASGWTSTPHNVIAPNTYTSPNITSPSGKTIAGLEFRLDSFETGGIYPICGISPDGRSRSSPCGCFSFGESGWYCDNYITTPVGYVIKTGTEKTSINLLVVPSNYDGCSGICWAEILVGSDNNITLYTRIPAGPAPAPPSPPLQTGNILGRVFVDTAGDLYRSNEAESLIGTSNPQVYVRYKLSSGGTWTFANNTTCCNGNWSTCTATNGPFSITNLPAGIYDINAYINVGPGWAFSEPLLNTFAINPSSSCIFSSGTRISGYCTPSEHSQGSCTNITIPSVTVTAGQTTYLWFGIKQTNGVIHGSIFMDDNGNGIKDAGESDFNLTSGNSLVTVSGQASTPITAADFNYSYSLADGTYTVGMILPPGYAVSGWNNGTIATLENTASITIASATDDKIVNFGIKYSPSPWFMIDKGDVGGKEGFSINVPTSLNLFESNDGGVLSQGTISFGEGNLGPSGTFNVGSYNPSLASTTFSALWEIANKDLAKSESIWDPIATPIENLNSGVYKINEDLTIDNSVSLTGKNLVIFVGNKTQTRNLTINSNINISDSSTLIFIVNGNINIDKDVTSIKSYLFAQNTIFTGTDYPTTNDQPLTIYGGLVTSTTGTLSLQRNLGSVGNLANPAERFYFEPKYLIVPRKQLGKHYYLWTEVN